ncbi:hypothetical protein HPB51_009575 [Rhipicephalus microplus]|uniref:Uncharacterized protein n=1 Tax=Rhipicephalus microplus TaxID=6941 RepID=A0A9J6ES90_RHIMP|nr:hypothetical protein HPB51_009575 [Rhipicephalus microplus]
MDGRCVPEADCDKYPWRKAVKPKVQTTTKATPGPVDEKFSATVKLIENLDKMELISVTLETYMSFDCVCVKSVLQAKFINGADRTIECYRDATIITDESYFEVVNDGGTKIVLKDPDHLLLRARNGASERPLEENAAAERHRDNHGVDIGTHAPAAAGTARTCTPQKKTRPQENSSHDTATTSEAPSEGKVNTRYSPYPTTTVAFRKETPSQNTRGCRARQPLVFDGDVPNCARAYKPFYTPLSNHQCLQAVGNI